MPAPLPRSVRFGYATGSVATGAFGTVPGLMLLPFLTDSLGIAALWAGFIVFLPKAWDVVLNPIDTRRIVPTRVIARATINPWRCCRVTRRVATTSPSHEWTKPKAPLPLFSGGGASFGDGWSSLLMASHRSERWVASFA